MKTGDARLFLVQHTKRGKYTNRPLRVTNGHYINKYLQTIQKGRERHKKSFQGLSKYSEIGIFGM
jgi:hypothetical protein